MPKKQRCPTCTSGWCKNHLLQLIPVANNLYYRKTFKIRLCPKLNKFTSQFEKTVPIFNKDKKFYTPCFFLEEEKKYYIDNDERVRKNHLLKMDEEPNSKNTIVIDILASFLRHFLINKIFIIQMVPRHARKRNYCFVCKCDYQDYLQHLDEFSHRNNLRKNCFTAFIIEAQQKFTKERIEQQSIKEDLKRQLPLLTDQSNSLGQTGPKSFDFIRKLTKLNQLQEKSEKELIKRQ